MIVLWFFIAFLTGGLIFAGSVLIGILINKYKKIQWLLPFSFPIASLLPCIIFYLLSPISYEVLNFKGIFNYINILLFFAASFIPSLIISFSVKGINKSTKWNKTIDFFEGMAMEIPQRLFMQVFFIVILSVYNYQHIEIIAVFLNALIWCLFIFMQEIFTKQKFNKTFFIEEISSFSFSIAAGFLLINSNLILLPMFAHGFERLLSVWLTKFKLQLSNKEI